MTKGFGQARRLNAMWANPKPSRESTRSVYPNFFSTRMRFLSRLNAPDLCDQRLCGDQGLHIQSVSSSRMGSSGGGFFPRRFRR